MGAGVLCRAGRVRQGRGWMNDGGIQKQEEENHAKSRDEGNKRREIAKGDVTSITYIHTPHTTTHIINKQTAPHTMQPQADVEPRSSCLTVASKLPTSNNPYRQDIRTHTYPHSKAIGSCPDSQTRGDTQRDVASSYNGGGSLTS